MVDTPADPPEEATIPDANGATATQLTDLSPAHQPAPLLPGPQPAQAIPMPAKHVAVESFEIHHAMNRA